LTGADITKIAGTVDLFCEGRLKPERGFCAAVSTEEIAKQDYILTPGRYVGIAEEAGDGEAFEEKMARLTGELGGLFAESRKLEKEIKKRLGAIGWEV
jgi:type I restriction enzyme M protein